MHPAKTKNHLKHNFIDFLQYFENALKKINIIK